MAVYVSMPFLVAAATGIYFLDKTHYQPKELGAGIRATIQYVVAKAKAKANTTQMPKLAPQFDGLDSFETLVGH
ncbi:unnamed protein product [Malus baccata var. baccata]